MAQTLTYAVAVGAGSAIIASTLVISRKGLLPKLAAALALAIIGALLITAARALA